MASRITARPVAPTRIRIENNIMIASVDEKKIKEIITDF